MKDRDALILLILLALIAMNQGEAHSVIEPTGWYDDSGNFHPQEF